MKKCTQTNYANYFDTMLLEVHETTIEYKFDRELNYIQTFMMR